MNWWEVTIVGAACWLGGAFQAVYMLARAGMLTVTQKGTRRVRDRKAVIVSAIPLDPDNPETRLLRAIFGECPDCDEIEPHEHPCKTCGKEQPLPDGSYCWHE